MIKIHKGAGVNAISFPMVEKGQVVQNVKPIDALSAGEKQFIINSVKEKDHVDG